MEDPSGKTGAIPSSRCFDWLWLLAFGLASSVWCLTAAGQVGVTFDEPFYIKAGLIKWRTGSNQPLLRAGTMTLPVDVQTLPIHLWEQFSGKKYAAEADLPVVLPVARAANLVFWWLLLIYAQRLGRTFGGVWGGRLALAFTACDPNLLGHAALATTDIASTATFLVLVYHFWIGRDQNWPRRVLIPGACFALAIQAKVSGLVFGLEAMTILGLWRLAAKGELIPREEADTREKISHFWHTCHPLRKDLAAIAAIGLGLVFAYTGSDWKADRNFVKWAAKLPEGRLRSVVLPLSERLTIFSNAGEGILYQFQHNVRGHDTFFLGEWHKRAVPEYFPVALTMKAPLPVIALLAVALLARPRGFLTPVAAVVLFFLALSPTYRVQIGIRFLFPTIVLGYAALGAAIGRPVVGQLRTERRQAYFLTPSCLRHFAFMMIFIMVATDVWIWPRGLCYFNQLWGGPDAGADLLHESNYDWGQTLPELREWCKTRGEERIAVWYYGLDPDVQHPPFIHVPLHNRPEDCDLRRLRAMSGNASYLAVSLGCFTLDANFTPGFRQAIDWVHTQTPVDRTMCFRIYKLE